MVALHKPGSSGVRWHAAGGWWRCALLHGSTGACEWPWNSSLGVGTEDPPPAVGQPPWHRATMVSLPLSHDGIESDVEDALASGYPVILVIEVTAEFDNADADGTIELPDIRSPAGDWHAVLVIGAANDDVRGRRLLIRNSWGEYWGAGGMHGSQWTISSSMLIRPRSSESDNTRRRDANGHRRIPAIDS